MTEGRDQPPTLPSSSGDASAARLVLEGRYRLGDELGRGGAGVVHEAKDLVADRDVAVKLLLPGPGAQPPRVRREVSALRLLHILGVVALLDEGVHDGRPFLVMELVAGGAFPGEGRGSSWEALAPVVERFLEALARVHAAGVLHRDLKPGNVLVDDEGRPTILDFGLSWGPSLGASVTDPGTVMGTPAYLAPEQLLGRPTDARTDLYAVGVMLFEALTGQTPHAGSDLHELIQQRVARPAIAVRRLRPQTPPHVAQVIDELLAARPEERPVSAGEVLGRLFGETRGAGRRLALPRLGGRAALDALLVAVREGRSADVCGPRGSGRSRLLADAADELARESRPVHWVAPASRPFASLNDLAGPLMELAGADLAAAQAQIDARIMSALAAGTVVFADDADRLDPWTAGALLRCRAAGGVVRVMPTPTFGAVETKLLSETDLRELFAGPDRVLHLREDAAHEMWMRTGGIAARVEAETAAWVRNGIAYADAGRFVVRRAALDAIRGSLPLTQPWEETSFGLRPRSAHAEDLLATIALAWPDSSIELLATVLKMPRWMLDAEIDALAGDGHVRRLPDGRVQPLVAPQGLVAWPPERRAAEHAAIAAALPAGTASRFRHLVGAGDAAVAADEAVLAADALTRAGDTGGAAVVLQQALARIRETKDAARQTRLLVAYAKTSLYDGTVLAVDQALYEVGRAPARTLLMAQLDRLLRGAADAARGSGESALAQLDACGAFDDPELELWRHAQRHRASRSLSVEREEQIVGDIAAWAERRGDPRSLRNAMLSRAQLLHRRGRYREAAELHLRVAEEAEHAPARISGLLNAASSLLEAGSLADVLRHARAARDSAADCRHHALEGRAEWLLRTAGYRMETTDAADLDLVESVSQVGEPMLDAKVCLTESAVAWRSGQETVARNLAARATRHWRAARGEWPALLSRALEIACGASPAPGERERMTELAASCPLPGIALQVVGLLARSEGVRRAGLQELAERRAAELASAAAAQRREVISPEEAVNWCSARL